MAMARGAARSDGACEAGRAWVSDPAAGHCAARSESVALPRDGWACARHCITARSESVALPRDDWACEAGRATFSERAVLDGRAGISEHAAEDSVARPIAQALLDSLLFYETLGKWYLWTAVVMPDHIHFIATVNLGKGIENTIMAWKRYQTTTLGVAFQRDYFEHRLRNEDEVVEKAEYIRNNPVLRGLADSPEAWPYCWHRQVNGALGERRPTA